MSKGFEMLNKELHKLLNKRRDELLEELNAIDVVLASDKSDVHNSLFKYYVNEGSNWIDGTKIYTDYLRFIVSPNDNKNWNKLHTDGEQDEVLCKLNACWADLKSNNFGTVIPVVPKDEESTWKEYLRVVIERLGGKARTGDVANVMINSIKDLSFVRARQIASDLLPELVGDGKLEIVRGESRKEGNTYIVPRREYKIK